MMNININTKILDEKVKSAKKLAKGKTIPVTENILLLAEKDELIIRSTNGEVSMEIIVSDPDSLEVVEEGGICVPAKDFSNIVSLLEGDDVNITVNNQQAVISSNKTKTRLAGTSSEEFPHFFDPKAFNKAMDVGGAELKSIFKKTAFACAEREVGQTALQGVCISSKNGEMKATGTDGHRLATYQTDVAFKAEEDLILPAETMTHMASVIADGDDVTIASQNSSSQVMFDAGAVRVFSRVFGEKYPDTDRLFPTEFNNQSEFNKQSLINAVRRTAVLVDGKNKAIKIEVPGENDEDSLMNAMKIESQNEAGHINDEVVADSVEGEGVTFMINAQYLLNNLHQLEGDTVNIGITGSMRPIVFSDEQTSGYKQILLPIRTY